MKTDKKGSVIHSSPFLLVREQLLHRWNYSDHFLQSRQVSLVVTVVVRQPLEALHDRHGWSYTAIIGPRPIIQCHGSLSSLTYAPRCRIRLHLHQGLVDSHPRISYQRYWERTTEHYGPDLSTMNVLCDCFHHSLLGSHIRRSQKSSKRLTFAFGVQAPSS